MQQPFALILCCLAIAVSACKDAHISYPEGGYEYPKNPTAKDARFYYCPLKDSMSRKDSFSASLDFFLFTYLHEPNLSVRPYGQDVFRLVYSAALGGVYSITVTEANIVVKRENPDFKNFVYNVYQDKISVFDEVPENYRPNPEKYLLWQIKQKFPFDTARQSKRGKRIIDSLFKVHPNLKDADYCWNLINKKMAPSRYLKIDSTVIPITKKDFRHIVDLINNSGYWQMPAQLECENYGSDGFGYSLEANTAAKYNYVSFGSCIIKTMQQKKFAEACAELVKYAKVTNAYISVDNPGVDTATMLAPKDTTK
jgi:hypothetical protein